MAPHARGDVHIMRYIIPWATCQLILQLLRLIPRLHNIVSKCQMASFSKVCDKSSPLLYNDHSKDTAAITKYHQQLLVYWLPDEESPRSLVVQQLQLMITYKAFTTRPLKSHLWVKLMTAWCTARDVSRHMYMQ